MIYLLKFLLVVLIVFCSTILYYVYNQFRLFSSSGESDGLSVLNKIFIKLMVWIVFLFILFLIGSTGFLLFSKIVIG